MKMIIKKNYILMLAAPSGLLLCAQQPTTTRQQQIETATIIGTMVDPLLSRDSATVACAVTGWKDMSQEVFDNFIAEIDALLGIDRSSVWAWFPSMWTKIKIVDAFKLNINLLRYGEFSSTTKDLQESARSLRTLLRDSLSAKQAAFGPVRPGLETAAIAYARNPHITTRSVIRYPTNNIKQ